MGAALSGFAARVEDTLIQPIHVTGSARHLTPAKADRNDPRLVSVRDLHLRLGDRERFSELNDPQDQRERFEAQMQARAKVMRKRSSSTRTT